MKSAPHSAGAQAFLCVEGIWAVMVGIRAIRLVGLGDLVIDSGDHPF